MDDDLDETSGPELNADEEAVLDEMPSLHDLGVSRSQEIGGVVWRIRELPITPDKLI